MRFVSATLRALAFLARFPAVPWAFRNGPHPLGGDVLAFPAAGILAGLPSAIAMISLPAAGLSGVVTAILAVAFMVAVTGALHEDGLADVADGLFGHHTGERALAIMKDSRVGSYGAIAHVLSLLMRVALVAELIVWSPVAAAVAFLGAAAASRGAMALLWATLPSADPGGLAAKVGQPNRRDGALSVLAGSVILVVCGGLAIGWGSAVLAAALGGITLAAFRGWLKCRLGGQTGDAIGAVQQLTEIAILIGLAIN